MKLQLLKDALIGYPAATVMITCAATGQRLQWFQAVAAGWYADLEGPSFRAFYSPEGARDLGPRQCNKCGFKLDGYAPGCDTCGACVAAGHVCACN